MSNQNVGVAVGVFEVICPFVINLASQTCPVRIATSSSLLQFSLAATAQLWALQIYSMLQGA